MSGAPKRLLFTVFLSALPACSLLVSLDDLQDGGPGGSDASANDAALDASTDKETGGDSSSSLDAGTDALLFFDDFDRPDSDTIGNGWLEKRASAFTLSNGVVQRTSDQTDDFIDNIVYRPSSENVTDTELSAEIEFAAGAGGYPQLHARVQSDTVTLAGTLDSYLFYVNDSSTAALSRERGLDNLTDLTTLSIAPPLVAGQRYRLVFRVTGSKPVVLYGEIDRLDSATPTVVAQGTVSDFDPSQLDDAGSVGFSAGKPESYLYFYDNFARSAP